MKCKYCGFDSEHEFISMVGAPCGCGRGHGCMVITCCHEAWMDHVRRAHPEQMEELKIQSSTPKVNEK